MANFNEIQDTDARQRLQEMQDVINKLETEEDPKAKQIRKLLESETDDDFREVLQEKLNQLENTSTVSVDQAVDMVANLGYDVIDVLQAGVMKKRDSFKASKKKQEAEAAKNND